MFKRLLNWLFFVEGEAPPRSVRVIDFTNNLGDPQEVSLAACRITEQDDGLFSGDAVIFHNLGYDQIRAGEFIVVDVNGTPKQFIIELVEGISLSATRVYLLGVPEESEG